MKNRISPHRIFVILFWIALWQLAGMVIQNDIIICRAGGRSPLPFSFASLCRILDLHHPLLRKNHPGFCSRLYRRNPSWKSCLPFSPASGTARAFNASGQIHSCGLLCHSGPHLDWLLRSFCVHFLPGRISHSLCKYHCRTGKHGS